MRQQELIQGYEQEIKYQQHMLENLARWLTLLFSLTSLGIVLAYSFHSNYMILSIFGWILAILSGLAMLVFGYGIYKGRLNLQKLVADFEQQRQRLH